eukprot:m.529731 g.529731  ORF g.529731 m.529731 type:complete len:1108 (+) comp22020_c0_seq2:118-3441(+)
MSYFARFIIMGAARRIMIHVTVWWWCCATGCDARGFMDRESSGLALTWFNNTAVVGKGSKKTVDSLLNIPLCSGTSCHRPHSVLLSGRIAPKAEGYFGFNVSFTPELDYPSPTAYARLWIHDHLLYPRDTTGGENSGGRRAPLWIPLPPRALNADAISVETGGAAPLSSYTFRFEYICLSTVGCANQTASIMWTDYRNASRHWNGDALTKNPVGFGASASQVRKFDPIPSSVLLPTVSPAEQERRALYQRLQTGWGTFSHKSMFTWVLLPESFAVEMGLFQLSTGAYLPTEGLTVNKGQLLPGASFAIRAGVHSYNQSYTQASLAWVSGHTGVNVSVETTVDAADSSLLTVQISIDPFPGVRVNQSDFAVVLAPNFTNGRAGTVHADEKQVTGTGAGLRSVSLHVIQGVGVALHDVQGLLPQTYTALLLGEADDAGNLNNVPVVLSADQSLSAVDVLRKTAEYRAAEMATLEPYGPEWSPVKDAMQTVLMWSLMYDAKEGLVAPEFQYTSGSGFAHGTIDGDTTEGLFCWDGSFASYMFSLDALDLAISNLVQVIKMRTAAGFIPSLSAGTFKSRDRSNPPVTAKVLHEIIKRWGVNDRTQWVVDLCFDDLFTWNTWMYTQRRETPLGMLSWGSNPFRYAPDGIGSGSDRGNGGGAATLESGLDNGPMTSGVPFNTTGLYLQDEYDAGYTGMFLMDCRAQIALAKIAGRPDAVGVLQERFDTVNKAMLATLWNETAGFFQNKLSANLQAVPHIAPTSFYPLLVGPRDGPSEAQAAKTIAMHLTNVTKFGVWPSASPPEDLVLPPDEARPLIQWYSQKCARGYGCPDSPHHLCCQLKCSLGEAEEVGTGYIQRMHAKVRYEGAALASIPAGMPDTDVIPLHEYNCTGSRGVDFALGPVGWTPAPGSGSCVQIVGVHPAMYVFKDPGSVLLALEQWYKSGDHYVVASDAGKADARAKNYTKVETLGYVYPPPGSSSVASRYGLPSISKDDADYKDQDYWHGRIWGPMVQLVYWGLEQYTSDVASGAAAGLVAQSKALLMKNWWGYAIADPINGSFAGLGRNVFENFGANTGEGWSFSSSATPLYSWGALTGFIGLQANGFYTPLNSTSP